MAAAATTPIPGRADAGPTKRPVPDYLMFIGCPNERRALCTSSPPRELRISTTTSVGKIKDAKIDYKRLHELLSEPGRLPLPIRLGDGSVVATAIITRTKIGGFAGQCSVVVSLDGARHVNVKIFHNGSLQCTGVDTPATGVLAIRAAYALCGRLSVLRSMNDTRPVVGAYRTVNINATYSLGHRINRQALYTVLVGYGMLVQYDPAFHAGVLLKHFTNTSFPEEDGICHCREGNTEPALQPPCIGKKGAGYRPGECRQITITIFQSGRMLINGARTYLQLRESFYCALAIFRRHLSEIRAADFSLEPTAEAFDVLRI